MSVPLRTSTLDLQKPAKGVFKTAFQNAKAGSNYAQAFSSNSQGGVKESALMVSEIGMSFVEEERRKQLLNEEAREQTLNLRAASFRKEEGNYQPSPFSTALTGDQQGRLSNSRYSNSPRQLRFQGMRDDSLLQGNQPILNSINILPDVKMTSWRKSNINTQPKSQHLRHSGSPVSLALVDRQDSSDSPAGQTRTLNFMSMVTITKKLKSFRATKEQVFRAVHNPLSSFDTMSILKESLKFDPGSEPIQSQYLQAKINKISHSLRKFEKQQSMMLNLQKSARTTSTDLSMAKTVRQINLETGIDLKKSNQDCNKQIREFHDIRKIENFNKQQNEIFRKRKNKISVVHAHKIHEVAQPNGIESEIARLQEEIDQVFEETGRRQTKQMPLAAESLVQMFHSKSEPAHSIADSNTGHIRVKNWAKRRDSGSTDLTHESLGDLGKPKEFSAIPSALLPKLKISKCISTDRSPSVFWLRQLKQDLRKHTASLPVIGKCK
jgi:hypothetical protein